MQPIKLFLKSQLKIEDEAILNYLIELIAQNRFDKLFNHLTEQQYSTIINQLNSKVINEFQANEVKENETKVEIKPKEEKSFSKEIEFEPIVIDLDILDVNFEKKLQELILQHKRVIVQGSTGTGKSTLIPAHLYKIFKKIIITEPRRLATVSVSRRVKEIILEKNSINSNTKNYKFFNTEYENCCITKDKDKCLNDKYECLNDKDKCLNDKDKCLNDKDKCLNNKYDCAKNQNNFENVVGYKVRFEDKSHPSNKILFCTDGVLLKNFKLIEDCLIIDEAHERSLNIDLILSLFKYYNLNSHLIIMSATLNLQKIINFFKVSLIINLTKKKFDISTFYLRKTSSNYLEEIYQLIINLLDIKNLDGLYIFDEIRNTIQNSTNILVFLPGKEEIFYLKKKLEKFNVYLLHSEMKIEDMNLIYKNEKYKIILSTNIAETSITIKDLDVVIDSGLFNQMEFKNLKKLSKKNISKSMADQRKGRIGRTKNGIVFRMYTKEDFNNFEEFNQPEILIANLDSIILKLLDLKIDIKNFDFIEEINEEKLEKSIQNLSLMGLIENNRINLTGKKVNELPINISLARLIIEGLNQNISHEILMIISILSSGNIKIEEYESKGDFFYFYKTFFNWKSCNFSISFLKNKNLNIKNLILAKNIYFQLLKYVNVSFSLEKNLYFTIVKVFLKVFNKNICKRIDKHFVNVYTGSVLYLHPNSIKLECKYVFYDEVIKIKNVYMQNVGELPYEIVKEMGLE